MTSVKSIVINIIKIMTVILLILVLSVSSVFSAGKLPYWAKQKKVAHAGGGIKGYVYTNSLEALQRTLKRGTRAIELDFTWTSDHKLVCCHRSTDFPLKMPTEEEFLKNKCRGRFTRMNAETALKLLAKYKKTYLITDSQLKYPVSVYKEIIRILSSTGNAYYKKHVVPQIYNKAQYAQFKKVYKFKYGIFTLYKVIPFNSKKLKSIVRFARKRKLVVTIEKFRLKKKRVRILKKSKVTYAVHTINTKKQWKKIRKKGASIMYSDFLI